MLRMSYCDHLTSVIVHPSLHTFDDFSETPGPIYFKPYVEPTVEAGLKFGQMVMVHLTRWPPCPNTVETLKNLLQNQESFGTESWYKAFRTLGLTSLFK